MQALKELIPQLPPELQEEVKEFAEFPLERRAKRFGRRLRPDLAVVLRKYKGQYTSFELQELNRESLTWISYLLGVGACPYLLKWASKIYKYLTKRLSFCFYNV